MSLLMDTQTNRFWARVDFLATGEIVLHIPEECELPIRVLVSRGGRSTEYEPNSSEKPNNCEHITEDGVTCAKYPACDDCPNNPLNKVKGSERLVKGSEQTKSTISKMEQVDEPQTYITEDRDTQILDAWQVHHRNTTSVEDEPQTERSDDDRDA